MLQKATKGILMADDLSTDEANLLELATELTIAWLANPNTRASAEEVPSFLQKMHGAVAALSAPQVTGDDEPAAAAEYTPAVGARKSLSSKDHIISMIDGKPYKTLKRHLATHGLTPAEYRARYNLKADYPMVSENYSEMRRETAKKLGLGRKPDTIPVAAKAAPAKGTKSTGAKLVAKASIRPAAAKSSGAKPARAKKAAAPTAASAQPATQA